MQLTLQQPWYLVGLCLLAGLVLAGLLYARDGTLPRRPRMALAALRTLSVSLLAFLLLGPLLRSVTTRTQRPVLAVATDRSASAAAAFDSLSSALDDFADRLSDRYEVLRLDLGEEVRESSADTSRDAASDLSSVFGYLAETVPAELTAGVVLVSDGMHNRGADPAYRAASLGAPVYTFGVGDTTPIRDASIAEVLNNSIAYLGDRLEVRVDVLATGLSGRSANVRLQAIGGGRSAELASETVRIVSDREVVQARFEITPKQAGTRRYRVSINRLEGETNVANNARDLFVEVLDARQRVLLLAAAPHPDVSAIRQALDANERYTTQFELFKDWSGRATDVDLVILHGLPRTGQNIAPLVTELDRRGVGRWWILGARTDLAALNPHVSLIDMRPRGGGEANAATGIVNQNFRLFGIGEDWAQRVAEWPPVPAPFLETGPLAGGAAMIVQRIGQVATDYPLLALGEVEGRREAVFFAQGLWRWRLAEYQREQSHDVFDDLIASTAQYLALREDKRPFVVRSTEKVYESSATVRLLGELYNASFEPINEADVSVRISDVEGTAYDFVMDRNQSGYVLDVGRLPAGEYNYRASTNYAGEAYRSDGSFVVRTLDLESRSTTADFALLRRMAEPQGGRLLTSVVELDALADELLGAKAAPALAYRTARTRPLVDWPWYLVAILAVLTVEWFWRRRLGTY